MGKSSSQAPAAPDPYQTANAQTASNVATARVNATLNRNNVTNPYYSSTWTNMGDPTRTTTGEARNPQSGGGAATGETGTTDRGSPNWEGQYQDGSTAYGGAPTNGTSSSGGGGAARRADGSIDPNDPNAGEQQYLNQDRWSQNITLNPQEQAILDQQRRMTLGAGNLAEGQLPGIQKALGQQVNYNGLPQLSTGVNYGALQSVDPNFQRGQIQNGVANAGQISTGLSGVGNNIQSQISDAGDLQRNLNVSGQWDLGAVGGPQRSMGTPDWGTQLAGVSNASYNQAKSRLDPQWQQSENDFAQNLADRGVPQGSPDWQKQMDAFQRQKTDAYQTAQNNATMQGNQLLGTLGGLELGQFGAENQAQGQQFGQTAQQRNDLFSQALQAGNFGNQAQQTAFGQNLAKGQFNNAAQGQLFGQDLAANQFQNQAQNQQYTQNANDMQLANQAQNQNVQQQQAQQQLALQLRQQGLTEQQVQAALAANARSTGYTEQNNVRLQPVNDARMLMGMGG